MRIAQSTHGIDAEAYLGAQKAHILSHRAVNHPFLKWYARTALTPAQERVLYLETACYFRDVPFYACALGALARDEAILRAVVHNLLDEVGAEPEASHIGMFADFLRSIGISAADEAAYTPQPSSVALNRGLADGYARPPLVRALGVMFTEEAQASSVMAAYDGGLTNQGYSAEQRHFWTMHIEAELEHSAAITACIAPYVQIGSDRQIFEESIDAYLALLEGYWDGVQSRIQALAAR